MNTKEFIEELEKNQELQKKFEGVNSPEKFYEIAKDNGLTDDLETMKSAAMQIVKAQGNVAEDDLAKLAEVSGGSETTENIAVSALSIGMATIGWGLSMI